MLLLVQDRGRRCFGGFVAGASWEPHETQYQGNGESFLFSSWPHGFRAHHWGRADEMFCLASLECHTGLHGAGASKATLNRNRLSCD